LTWLVKFARQIGCNRVQPLAPFDNCFQ
jgi:hypothetical protein